MCVCMVVRACVCVSVCHVNETRVKLAYLLHAINTTRHTPIHPIIRSFLPHFLLPFFPPSFLLLSTVLYFAVRSVEVLRWFGLQSEGVCSAFTHISKAKAFISSYSSPSSSSSTFTSPSNDR